MHLLYHWKDDALACLQVGHLKLGKREILGLDSAQSNRLKKSAPGCGLMFGVHDAPLLACQLSKELIGTLWIGLYCRNRKLDLPLIHFCLLATFDNRAQQLQCFAPCFDESSDQAAVIGGDGCFDFGNLAVNRLIFDIK